MMLQASEGEGCGAGAAIITTIVTLLMAAAHRPRADRCEWQVPRGPQGPRTKRMAVLSIHLPTHQTAGVRKLPVEYSWGVPPGEHPLESIPVEYPLWSILYGVSLGSIPVEYPCGVPPGEHPCGEFLWHIPVEYPCGVSLGSFSCGVSLVAYPCGVSLWSIAVEYR